MKKILIKIVLSLIILMLMFILFSAFIIIANDFKPGNQKITPVCIGQRELDSELIQIVTWNMGYAGLGAEADFFTDGGSRFKPVSKEYTLNHIDAFVKFIVDLKNDSVDFFFLQEAAQKSSFIFNTNPYASLRKALPGYCSLYSPILAIKWFPIIGSLHSGNVIFSKYFPHAVMRQQLPVEEGPVSFLSPKYNFIEARFKAFQSGKEWVLINLHLSAFDEGGLLRKKQLEFLSRFMAAEYNKGNYVVIGGDWNHRLANVEFPNTTEKKYLFWLQDLPEDFTPAHWQWGIDRSHPTVRSNERPYKRNENFTCIIDGFLVSPNVQIVSVRTFNLYFKNSDHNPVLITLKAKD